MHPVAFFSSRLASIYRAFCIFQTIPVSFSSIKNSVVNEGIKGPEDHEGLKYFFYIIIPWNYAGQQPCPIIFLTTSGSFYRWFWSRLHGKQQSYCRVIHHGVRVAMSLLAINVQHPVIFPSVPGKLEQLVTPCRAIRNMCLGDMKTWEQFLDLCHTSCVMLGK